MERESTDPSVLGTCVVSETGALVCGERKKSRVSRRVCTPTLDTLGQRLFKSSWEFACGAFAPPNDRASNASNASCTNEPTGRLLYLAPWLKTPPYRPSLRSMELASSSAALFPSLSLFHAPVFLRSMRSRPVTESIVTPWSRCTSIMIRCAIA